MIVIIFIWYPKCSTCKKAKDYLDQRELNYQVRDIVQDSLSYAELKKYYEMSGLELKRFFNTSGLKYRDLGLKEQLDSMSDEEKLKLLSSDGMLVKRPILISNDKVLIGFKEKEWSEIK